MEGRETGFRRGRRLAAVRRSVRPAGFDGPARSLALAARAFAGRVAPPWQGGRFRLHAVLAAATPPLRFRRAVDKPSRVCRWALTDGGYRYGRPRLVPVARLAGLYPGRFLRLRSDGLGRYLKLLLGTYVC